MGKDFSEYVYSVEDIDKAFDMGFAAAIDQFGEMIDFLYETQKRILHTLRDMQPEREDKSVVVNNNRDKVIDLGLYLRR